MVDPTTHINCLGIELNAVSMTLSLPEAKLLVNQVLESSLDKNRSTKRRPQSSGWSALLGSNCRKRRANFSLPYI